MSFLHLHLHSDRSQFDGLIRLKDLLEFSNEYGLKSVSVTDHGNISIAVNLFKMCQQNDLKPIFGIEAYIVRDKTVKDRKTNHIVLLAKNKVGFQNLKILNTISFEYFYYHPRIDFSDLQKYGEGLIVTSACIAGIPAVSFLHGGKQALRESIQPFLDLFGDDFYLEIEPFQTGQQKAFNKACIELCESDSSIKLVATGDCHYPKKEDREIHQAYMAIKGRYSVREKDRYPYIGYFHMKTYDEMVEDFSTLHGFDITSNSCFMSALEAPKEIEQKIESFDIREGIRIPQFHGC